MESTESQNPWLHYYQVDAQKHSIWGGGHEYSLSGASMHRLIQGTRASRKAGTRCIRMPCLLIWTSLVLGGANVWVQLSVSAWSHTEVGNEARRDRERHWEVLLGSIKFCNMLRIFSSLQV